MESIKSKIEFDYERNCINVYGASITASDVSDYAINAFKAEEALYSDLSSCPPVLENQIGWVKIIKTNSIEPIPVCAEWATKKSIGDGPLADSGNRSDLAGTGAERDINEENGRCDLLPASAICDVIEFMRLHSPGKLAPREFTVISALCAFINNGNRESLLRAAKILLAQDACEELIMSEWEVVANNLLDLSVHYKNGAEKYAERNWEKGLPIHSFMDSAIRHLLKSVKGMKDEPHWTAALWNVMGALWTLEHKPELDDIPHYGRKEINDDKAKEEIRFLSRHEQIALTEVIDKYNASGGFGAPEGTPTPKEKGEPEPCVHCGKSEGCTCACSQEGELNLGNTEYTAEGYEAEQRG